MIMTWAVVRFVLPRFLDLYDGMHVELPLFSQIVIAIVRIVNNPYVTFGALASIVAAWHYRDELLQRLVERALQWPGTRTFIGQLLATTFCDVVGHLYADGVAISTSLEMLASTTRLKVYRRKLQLATAQFKIDGRLSEALKELAFFPTSVSRMIKIGEETGQIDKMLFCIGTMLDESNQELFTRAVSIIEPVMMAGVGIVLCFFFVGLFLPIYGLLSHLGM
jgi:type IV pilus assembly protein PilC